MSDKPRYYTTSISATRTVNEIAGILAEKGASETGVKYDADGNPTGLSFRMRVPGQGEVPVLLRAQIEALTKRLDGDRDQARKTAWRQLKSYVEMSMEMVENEVVEFHDLFLSGVQLGEQVTVGDMIEHAGVDRFIEAASGARQLEPADEDSGDGMVDADYEIVEG